MVTYSLALRNRAAAEKKLLAVRGGYRKLQVSVNSTCGVLTMIFWDGIANLLRTGDSLLWRGSIETPVERKFQTQRRRKLPC